MKKKHKINAWKLLKIIILLIFILKKIKNGSGNPIVGAEGGSITGKISLRYFFIKF